MSLSSSIGLLSDIPHAVVEPDASVLTKPKAASVHLPPEADFDLATAIEIMEDSEYQCEVGEVGASSDVIPPAPAEPTYLDHHVILRHWCSSVLVASRFLDFVQSVESQSFSDRAPSLILRQVEGGLATELVTSIEYVFWDDTENLIGRRTRVEGLYLNFTPKPLPGSHAYVCYKDVGLSFVMRNIGQTMVRRSGRCRPTIPWQTALYHDFLMTVHASADYDAEPGPLKCRACKRHTRETQEVSGKV